MRAAAAEARGAEGDEAGTLRAYVRERYRASSVSQLGYRIERYVRYVGEARASAGTYEDVLAYVAALRDRGLHARTLRHELAAVKLYYEWLLDSGRRRDHPCRTMRLADPVDRRVRLDELYDREQLEGLLSGYRANDAREQERGEVIVGLLVHQALSAGEVTRVRLGDVDLEAGTIYVGGGGKTAARTLGLRASQVMALWRYVGAERGRYAALAEGKGLRSDYLLFDRHGRQLVGSRLKRIINQGREAREALRPQKIRQTVIAGLVAAGHDVRVVQAFAGHRKSSATEAYKRTGWEELAEAVMKNHPRE